MDGKRHTESLFPVRLAIVLLGVAGITAQAVLLRELLIQYHGNEFSVGIIIGNWVAASALGAFLAGRHRWRSHPVRSFILLTLLFSFIFPLCILLCRVFKPFAGIQPGMGLTFGEMFSSSLLLLLLPAALQGGLFIVATKLYSHRAGDAEGAPGKSYALDSAGTMLGGLVSSCLLVPLLSPLQVAGLLLLCGGVVSVVLSRTALREGGFAPPSLPLSMFLAALLLLAGGSAWMEGVSLARQWQGREVISSRNSPYQNITVIRDGGQLTVYTDGLPFTTLPDPDIASLEELAHIPALVHPHPVTVLLIGGSSGGLPAELLKHPSVERIDCLEHDPALLRTVTDLRQGAAADAGGERVRPHFLDGRRFLRKTESRYDLILLNTPLPLSLQANRYFSREFFSLVRARLRPGGLLAFATPGSTAYYSQELRGITATLRETASAVFPRVEIVPGESNLFLVFAGSGAESFAAPLLRQRLQERGIRAALITPEYLFWRLDPSQAQWFAISMAGESFRPNLDLTPRLLTIDLVQRTALFNPWLKPVLTGSARIGAVGLAVVALLVMVVFSLLGTRRSSIALPCLIASSGMTAMLLELMLIFVFQICSGVMFQAIALLIALFMGGLCCGSLSFAGRRGDDYRRLLTAEAGLLILCVMLFGLFSLDGLPTASPEPIIGGIMPLLFAAGFLTGMEFPPAVRLVQKGGVDAETAGVGTVYGADLLGGWFGGMLGGMLLPFLGFAACCAVLVSLKLSGLLLLHMQRKKCRI